ncbi:MAG: sensor domain-containing diguanylate cyclase [Gammaproteobacteria bacterium]|nr:sensor domain-containing diguanylate cyclase [Gammaproteobacteria bacterium]MBT5152926.1 sensor domain-containing diguanylate cyclase [Gammaproteobacteria bacterium]MBT5724377.1 sensor domain-containing diguanylate cyclase [Gammaproteobacteria bacterium]MBT6893129.1 sensor domain-containing diguanylate cyclase [Gammaproteobacteria bacterium]
MSDKTTDNAYLRLIEIGKALSAERNIDSLLQHILEEAKSLATADAGTIYLNLDKISLKFAIVLNDTLDSRRDNASGSMNLPDISLYNSDGSPNLNNIASSAAHSGETIVVGDVASIEELGFSGPKKFSKLLDYPTISLLTVPLKTMADESLGVLQLLNATDSKGYFVPFSDGIIPLIEALASQASVAMENRALLDEQEAQKQQLEREVDARTGELKDALTRLSEAHINLKEMNTFDVVTGIHNRQYFNESLEQEWRRAKREGYEVSMLMLDIDHFKRVNDTYGHLAGDECLAAIAKEVDRMFNRPSDVVARYGGEEFVVVLPYISADNARRLAEQLREIIEGSTYLADGHDLQVTVSIGVATASPNDEVRSRDLIGWSDTVLYEAKSAGRNQVRQHR